MFPSVKGASPAVSMGARPYGSPYATTPATKPAYVLSSTANTPSNSTTQANTPISPHPNALAKQRPSVTFNLAGGILPAGRSEDDEEEDDHVITPHKQQHRAISRENEADKLTRAHDEYSSNNGEITFTLQQKPLSQVHLAAAVAAVAAEEDARTQGGLPVTNGNMTNRLSGHKPKNINAVELRKAIRSNDGGVPSSPSPTSASSTNGHNLYVSVHDSPLSPRTARNGIQTVPASSSSSSSSSTTSAAFNFPTSSRRPSISMYSPSGASPRARLPASAMSIAPHNFFDRSRYDEIVNEEDDEANILPGAGLRRRRRKKKEDESTDEEEEERREEEKRQAIQAYLADQAANQLAVKPFDPKALKNVAPKVPRAAEASRHKPGGGNVKIFHEKLHFDHVEPKVPLARPSPTSSKPNNPLSPNHNNNNNNNNINGAYHKRSSLDGIYYPNVPAHTEDDGKSEDLVNPLLAQLRSKWELSWTHNEPEENKEKKKKKKKNIIYELDL